MRDDDVSITDLRIVVDEKTGIADLAWYAGDLQLVEGTANLQQALMLRILVGRGELRELGHSRYGSHVSELIGEPWTRRTWSFCAATCDKRYARIRA